MCSWCYGFTPVLDRILDLFDDKLGFRLVLGGLRPGKWAIPMDDEMKTYLRRHWGEVNKATGLPFNESFLDRDGFLYDTDPPSRGIIAVREMDPQKEYPFFKAIQKAFYTGNTVFEKEEDFTALLRSMELDETAFMDLFNAPKVVKTLSVDYAEVRRMGAQGFPSLYLHTGTQVMPVISGYQPAEIVVEALDILMGESVTAPVS